jgi:hypothetical protein
MDSSGNDGDDAGGDPMEAADPSGDTAAAGFPEDGHGESTECSSSFGPSCSVSDDDDEARSGLHDMEVDSPFFGHINAGGAASVPEAVRCASIRNGPCEIGVLSWRGFLCLFRKEIKIGISWPQETEIDRLWML